ncbi:MAG: mandelate racemase/muconate lactonizing enzyme family protein [Chloroflexi bacterium]|nr:MAG: mandelate racemase/muconate lactonizing enzyme family protein [Phototrophicales bacterium]RMF80782.1 MAG: mandelate racemase/muconate lactonizing enzyme family protein [Chloroflexota bacterium]
MKITQVEIIPLQRKLDNPFEGGTYRIVNRYTIVTRIHTDEGITGETFGGDEDFGQDKVVKVLRDYLAPLLIGEDPRNVERIWAKMWAQKVDLGNRSIHILDLYNYGMFMQGIAALDNALWDLLGKIHGEPVARLLGGHAEKVPIIAIGGYYQAGKGQDELNEEMTYYKEIGMAGVKFKVGRKTLKEDIERVARVREIVGDDFIITCDANQAWSPQEAIEFCRQAESLNLAWIEEPVRWYDTFEGLRMVRDSTSIPVNAGQGEISAFGCRDLMLRGSVDVLNVDVTIAGGVTEWRRIAHMAQLMHVQMAHHEEPQIALHLLASVPNSLYVEIFPNYERDPMWVDLPQEQPRIADGYMYLPDKPGFGIDLNQDIIEKYRAD